MMAQSIQPLPIGIVVLRIVLIPYRAEGGGLGCPVLPREGCRVLVFPIGGAVNLELHIIERQGIHLAR